MKPFPPYEFLMRVLHNSPKSALLFMWLWAEKKENNSIKTHKEIVTEFFPWKAVKNALMVLQRLEVLTYTITLSNRILVNLKDQTDSQNTKIAKLVF